MVNYIPNGKVMILHLIVELIKTIFLYKMIYFPPYGHSKNEKKIDLDSCSYATKSDLKNATGVDKSKFAKKLFS